MLLPDEVWTYLPKKCIYAHPFFAKTLLCPEKKPEETHVLKLIIMQRHGMVYEQPHKDVKKQRKLQWRKISALTELEATTFFFPLLFFPFFFCFFLIFLPSRSLPWPTKLSRKTRSAQMNKVRQLQTKRAKQQQMRELWRHMPQSSNCQGAASCSSNQFSNVLTLSFYKWV